MPRLRVGPHQGREFRPSRNFRRILELNRDIVGTVTRPEPSREQYSLFRRYLDARHGDGGMADMTAIDYATMIEDSHVETRLVEYRLSEKNADGERPLVAACLTDLLADGLSMVYSFYEPDEQQRSFGTYMILDHIERARRLGLPHVYLGYWVEGSRKMAYKARFLPQERLGMNGWEAGGVAPGSRRRCVRRPSPKLVVLRKSFRRQAAGFGAVADPIAQFARAATVNVRPAAVLPGQAVARARKP